MRYQRSICTLLLVSALALSPAPGRPSTAQAASPGAPAGLRQVGGQLPPPTAAPCCILGSWHLATTAGPGPRTKMAMAYDSARHRAVLFGGVGGSGGVQGDTWEWDGTAWTLRATAGPGAREEHAMAYDAARGRVVLFGGWDAGGNLKGDTWEWDGTAWTLKSNSGPAPRSRHAMAYDSGRGKVILFGGWAAPTDRHDTWEWDGAVWMLKSNSGPPALEFHGLADDSARGRVVLFDDGAGGTWEWDGASWTRMSTNGPSRYGHAMASSCGKVTIFGGVAGTHPYVGDTWQWDGAVWTQVAATGPAPRVGASMVYDSFNGQLVLYGGYAGGVPYSDETWTMGSAAMNPDPDFQLTATLPAGNSPTYQLTATAAPLQPGASFWWRVEELDAVTGAVLPNTTETNPSAWWANPTTNVFSGYYNNSSPIGVFYQGHKYRVSRGTWSSCTPWSAVSKTVFLCNNC